MYCTRNITQDLIWVGGNDRRIARFEGIYAVPRGVSYNAYLLLDEQTVLMDTVDQSIAPLFLENVAHALGGRPLDHVVVQHMEPDHSATLAALMERYPGARVVCNAKTFAMIEQFFGPQDATRFHLVREGDTLSCGRHVLHFAMAPMVHWPEVMVTYDSTDRILFSADAFGTFGALDGAIFADEVDFFQNYMDEARRYYCNIVGKYGPQVQALLRKAAAWEIAMICPLHGFVFRHRLGEYIQKYQSWSTYTPEENGVVLAYASVYGHTAQAADTLAARLRERGMRVVVYDVSVTPLDEILAAAFRYSHLVFASVTYNAGLFPAMETLLHELVAHNLQNRAVALLENGSWAPTAGGLMRALLEKCKGVTFLSEPLAIRSALKETQEADLVALADAIALGKA